LPTYSADPRFRHELAGLSQAEVRAFLRAKDRLVAALKAGRMLDVELGVHQMTDHPGIFEFWFSARGRATFHYGTDGRGPSAHVV
jgi:hypothetical protein